MIRWLLYGGYLIVLFGLAAVLVSSAVLTIEGAIRWIRWVRDGS